MSIQKINVKNTYVATVKSDVANRALSFYINNDKKDIFVENSVFPSVETNAIPSVDNVDLNDVINNTAENNNVENNVINADIEIPQELNIDNTVNIPIVNGENIQTVTPDIPSVEIKTENESVSNVNSMPEIPDLNILETSSVENNPSPEPMPMPNIPEAIIHPEPIPNPVTTEPVNPTPVNDNFANVEMMVNNAVNNNINDKPPMFNASNETNLLGALEENKGHSSIGNINVTPENLNIVREFGVDEPIVTDQNGNPIPNTAKGGFANSKILLFFVIILFMGSCVFLGYEIYKYVNLPK